MKKSSNGAIERIQIFKQQLTIGLDLRDRTSNYCILNEAGDVILERKLPTPPQGIEEVFSRIPRSRVALETGTHSPWVSRQLTQLGHEAIVAHVRNVRLIGDSIRKENQHDARTLARPARFELIEYAHLAGSDYRLSKTAYGRMATEAARSQRIHISETKTVLILTGLLMEGLSDADDRFLLPLW